MAVNLTIYALPIAQIRPRTGDFVEIVQEGRPCIHATITPIAQASRRPSDPKGRPPTMSAVEFSTDSDIPTDKTEQARLKRRQRAQQDGNDEEQQPTVKRRKNGGVAAGLTAEEREKLLRTSQRLRKEADKLPVNEGEPTACEPRLERLLTTLRDRLFQPRTP